MKKLLLTGFLASAITSLAQTKMYDSFGYESYMYGNYVAYTDGWKGGGGTEANYQIIDEGTNGRGGLSDACLHMIGRKDTGAAVQLYKFLKDDWETQVVNGNYVLVVDFDIRNNTAANSPTLNAFQFEILENVVDENGVDSYIALCAMYFAPKSGEIRALGSTGLTGNYNWIGNSFTHGFVPTRNSWVHIRMTYNTRTGYTQFEYGDKKFVETGNLRGNGDYTLIQIDENPSSNFVHTSPLKGKNPGLIRFINRSGGRAATATSPAIDNTAASDFLIDNLVIKASTAVATIGTDEMVEENKSYRLYLDQEKTLQINQKIAVKDIQVYDCNAKLVATAQNTNSLALSDLPPSVYIVKYLEDKKYYTKRIIIR